MLPDQNSNSNTKKKRILAVDDEPDITLTVKAGLEATGLFQVNTFNDPELALSSFKPRLYDIVLLDFISIFEKTEITLFAWNSEYRCRTCNNVIELYHKFFNK